MEGSGLSAVVVMSSSSGSLGQISGCRGVTLSNVTLSHQSPVLGRPRIPEGINRGSHGAERRRGRALLGGPVLPPLLSLSLSLSLLCPTARHHGGPPAVPVAVDSPLSPRSSGCAVQLSPPSLLISLDRAALSLSLLSLPPLPDRQSVGETSADTYLVIPITGEVRCRLSGRCIRLKHAHIADTSIACMGARQVQGRRQTQWGGRRKRSLEEAPLSRRRGPRGAEREGEGGGRERREGEEGEKGGGEGRVDGHWHCRWAAMVACSGAEAGGPPCSALRSAP